MLVYYLQLKATKGNNIKKSKIWNTIISKHQEEYEERNKKAIQVSIIILNHLILFII